MPHRLRPVPGCAAELWIDNKTQENKERLARIKIRYDRKRIQSDKEFTVSVPEKSTTAAFPDMRKTPTGCILGDGESLTVKDGSEFWKNWGQLLTPMTMNGPPVS